MPNELGPDRPANGLMLSNDLILAIRSFPSHRMVRCECGTETRLSPLAIHMTCSACRKERKLRSVGAVTELEDVFDAVLEWTCRADVQEHVSERRREILHDPDLEE